MCGLFSRNAKNTAFIIYSRLTKSAKRPISLNSHWTPLIFEHRIKFSEMTANSWLWDWHESFVTIHVLISRTRIASTPVIHPSVHPLTHTDSVNVCGSLITSKKIHSIHNVVHKISIQVQPPVLNLTFYRRRHSGSIRQHGYFTETFLVILFHNI